MAIHNKGRLVGYLLEDPSIANKGEQGAEKVFLTIRTIRRDSDIGTQRYEDVFVFYDGEKMIEKMKRLKKYDIVDITGVLNIVSAPKPSRCPHCGAYHYKENGTYTFIYPIHFRKLDNIMNSYEYSVKLPDAILFNHYREVSNSITLIGTVVSEPEKLSTPKKEQARYRLGINRKYFVTTQPDVKADYPWVYTYGQQAEDDLRHLLLNAVIFVDGYIRTRNVQVKTSCENCGGEYTYPDVVTDVVPFSVEYCSGHKTDEDIAREEELALRNAMLQGSV